jgi:lysophospholipase L1-like esterase
VSRSRARRLRTFLGGGVVGALAVPSILAVTRVVAFGPALGGSGTLPRRQAVVAQPAYAPARPERVAAVRGAVQRRGAVHRRSAVRASAAASRRPPKSTTTHRVHQVVALGDSVPAGTACGCDDYVTLLARSLSTASGPAVASTNLALPGAASGDVLGQLTGAATRAAVAGADVVVVTVGANDVEAADDPTTCPSTDGQGSDGIVAACYEQELRMLSAHLGGLLDRIQRLTGSRGTRVLVTGYWNVFLDGAVGRSKGPAYVELADAVTRAVNRRIAAAAQAHGGTYVDLFTPFRGRNGTNDCTGLLAADGDHPDADGHALIARTLAASV